MRLPEISKRPLDILLIGVGAISILALFLANEDPFGREAFCSATSFCLTSAHADALNKIVYDMAVAALASLTFYVLLVRLPELQKRQRYKRIFTAQYLAFRKSCIAAILAVSNGSYDTRFSDSLLDQKVFRSYFSESVTSDQNRWHRFCNQLDKLYLKEILTQLEIFRDDISFILNSIDVPSDRPLRFLRRLSAAIYTYRDSSLEYDDVKRFAGFLWELFAGFNMIDGYKEQNIIQEMIDAI